MGRKKSGGGQPRRLGGQEVAAFIGALEAGATVMAAAKAAGCSHGTAYNRRRKDAAFRAAWDEAVEKSNRPWLIAPKNGRKLQKWKPRPIKFTAERKATYLTHFAATCDSDAAARLAGVGDATVYTHRRTDPEFAEAWAEALDQGYARLEAELARQRLDAAARFRAAIDKGAAAPIEGQEFERGLALLKLYGARGQRATARTRGAKGAKAWSFAEAITALEKKLTGLGYTIAEDGAARADDDLGA